LERKSILWRDWSVTFYVLGASHAVLFQRDSVRFMEILACLPRDEEVWSNKSDLLFTSRGDIFTESSRSIDNLAVRFQILPFAIEDISSLKNYDPECFMQVPFALEEPALGNAVTQVGWAFDDTRLSIETLHSYPEESKAVRTTTIFEELKH
jgi:hypothetical protein